MVDVNIFDVLFNFFDVVVKFGINAYDFLFQNIRILGYDIQLFYLLGGGAFTILMVAWIIRRFI